MWEFDSRHFLPCFCLVISICDTVAICFCSLEQPRRFACRSESRVCRLGGPIVSTSWCICVLCRRVVFLHAEYQRTGNNRPPIKFEGVRCWEGMLICTTFQSNRTGLCVYKRALRALRGPANYNTYVRLSFNANGLCHFRRNLQSKLLAQNSTSKMASPSSNYVH